jgi:hypothetical protein
VSLGRKVLPVGPGFEPVGVDLLEHRIEALAEEHSQGWFVGIDDLEECLSCGGRAAGGLLSQRAQRGAGEDRRTPGWPGGSGDCPQFPALLRG